MWFFMLICSARLLFQLRICMNVFCCDIKCSYSLFFLKHVYADFHCCHFYRRERAIDAPIITVNLKPTSKLQKAPSLTSSHLQGLYTAGTTSVSSSSLEIKWNALGIDSFLRSIEGTVLQFSLLPISVTFYGGLSWIVTVGNLKFSSTI